MIYKVIFNIPNEKYPTEIHISKERMEYLAPKLSIKGHIVEIDGCYFNTSYFVKAIPDAEMSRMDAAPDRLRLQEAPRTPEEIANREVINELKSSIFKRIQK
jgi:hypothetical protein